MQLVDPATNSLLLGLKRAVAQSNMARGPLKIAVRLLDRAYPVAHEIQVGMCLLQRGRVRVAPRGVDERRRQPGAVCVPVVRTEHLAQGIDNKLLRRGIYDAACGRKMAQKQVGGMQNTGRSLQRHWLAVVQRYRLGCAVEKLALALGAPGRLVLAKPGAQPRPLGVQRIDTGLCLLARVKCALPALRLGTPLGQLLFDGPEPLLRCLY